MKYFIGMETSGTLRNRLPDALSCDLLPQDDDEPGHFTGDVFEVLEILARMGWKPDFAVFHPECTYHTLSAAWAFGPGPYHQKVKPGTLTGAARHAARASAEQDAERIRLLPFWKMVENPRGTLPTRTNYGPPCDVVQPYEFGDDASKATCLWLFDPNGRKVPFKLKRNPALYVPPRITPDGKARWANQTDSGQNRVTPGADRWKDRSKTYNGIADAIAAFIMERKD